nr:hypothetical protein [Tanacetum cinerariifolium]
MEPLDALLIRNEVVSTTPVRENDKFIKSSVDDLVLNLRESKVTFVCNLECGMPFDSPHLPRTNVLRDAKVEIDLPFGEQVDTLLMGDREIDFNSFRDLGNLRSSLVDDPVPIPRMFDEPLGNSNSMSRSFETSDFLLEELTAEIGLDNLIPKKINDGYYDSHGDILYLEQLLDEDTSFNPSPSSLPKESSLLVPPIPGFKQICLRVVERLILFLPNTVW